VGTIHRLRRILCMNWGQGRRDGHIKDVGCCVSDKVGLGMASCSSFRNIVNSIPFDCLEVLGVVLENFPECHKNFLAYIPFTNTCIS